MGEDSEEPESGAGEAQPPKKRAEENAWYLLATLFGVPDWGDEELHAKNRVPWNRYFAANLDEQTRARLIEEKRFSAEELTPFSPEELEKVQAAFARRCTASGKKLALPSSNAAIDFSDVAFEQENSFVEYLFCNASFFGAVFAGRALFRSAAFTGQTYFLGTSFSDIAYSQGATYSGRAAFQRADFSRGVYFDRTVFSDDAFFSLATFGSLASFRGVVFSGLSDFDKATFNATSSFTNAEMKGETSYEDALFKIEPPRFFSAKLHQSTIWPGSNWPTPQAAELARPFIDAYACLKLEMDRLKKHEDELDFFALELQSRRVLLGRWGWGLPIAIYGVFSDYGRSYLRPLAALFSLALIGTLAFLPSDSLSPWQSLGLSVANTLNVFGFRKDFFEPAVIAHLPAWLEVFSALQTILGTILLFLFGLGIRNKFRMK